MPSLLDLPPELIHQVYDVAHPSTVCRLRLTCRALCKLGDEHLLHEIYAYALPGSLENIERIASSRPTIRAAIKSLCFQVDGTDDWLNFVPNGDPKRFDHWNASRHYQYKSERRRYESLLDKYGTSDAIHGQSEVYAALLDCYRTNGRANEQYPLDMNEMDEFSEDEIDGSDTVPRNNDASGDPALRLAFEHYNQLIEDERSLKHGHGYRDGLKALFTSCPNLTKLSFNLKDILHPNSAFINPIWLGGLLIPHGDLAHTAGDSAARVFHEVMLAASEASLNLKDLSVGIGSAVLAATVGENDIFKAMKSLVRLHWNFECPSEWTNEPSEQNFARFINCVSQGYLANVLLACPELETLHLDLMYRSLATTRADLQFVLPGRPALQHLRHVRITNFQTTPKRLASFILDRALTLQSLHLHNAHLYEFRVEGDDVHEQFDENGTFWQTCIDAFAGKMPHLKKVRLTGRFTSYASNGTWYYGRKSRSCSGDDGYERNSSEVIDYILTGTSQYHFPAPSWDEDLRRFDRIWGVDEDDSSELSVSSLDEEDMMDMMDEIQAMAEEEVTETDDSETEDEEA